MPTTPKKANDLSGAGIDGKARTLVITPHPGEMARLLGITVARG